MIGHGVEQHTVHVEQYSTQLSCRFTFAVSVNLRLKRHVNMIFFSYKTADTAMAFPSSFRRAVPWSCLLRNNP